MLTFSANRDPVGEVGEVGGRPVVLHYGDVAAEYSALRTGALLVDRTMRGRMRVSGARAREIVTGLVTNDVGELEAGQGAYAAALTPKGKIVADVRIFAEADSLLLDVPPRAAAGFGSMIRKYVNPRLAPYRDELETLTDLCVIGANARLVVAEATGAHTATLGTLAPYHHISVELEGATLMVARVPDVGVDAYELFVPTPVHDVVRARLLAAGARAGGLQAWEIARVEAGRPEWGIDIDETTIPQEANFDELHAISYTKGCYVGQETVARVHFRGHVNRHLRGIVFEGDAPAPAGASLTDASAKAVGDVRSSLVSPRSGAIALAMVRREVAPGTTVTATHEGVTRTGHVVELPFPG
ncbi:MAG TPA: glycine cleavage T C-terminal barrel domain-containing protein [Gemmatimonadaceae bacterium]|nr:glycine cleavage T C-terminal barrel domain-containing protein [Gemmatimonadaceae bacterium]